MSDSENSMEQAKKELEEYLQKNPQLKGYQDRIEQSLLLIGENPLNRFEFMLDLTIGHLELLSETINKLKPEYGIKEE